MPYCANCGKELREGAKFCDNCGRPVNPTNDYTKREAVYEGKIHKCPNCGDIIDAYETVCGSCGYEIRSGSLVSAVRELSLKLEKISERKMPELQEKRSIRDVFFGDSSERAEREEEAKANFASEKEKEKASLITNFVVPNTKEDIIEFMLLAVSNIESIEDLSNEVAQAWIAKANLVYQKAKLSMQGMQEFETVQSLYERVQSLYEKWKKRVRSKKIKEVLVLVGLGLVFLFSCCLLWNPEVTLIVTVIVLAIAAVVAIIIAIVKVKQRRD